MINCISIAAVSELVHGAVYDSPIIIAQILVDNTELSTLEIARRHVTHLDRFKYRKKTSRCHKIRYRKVRTF